MKDRIILTGRIEFEPEDLTNKHIEQASWKKVAMVYFEGEMCEYYAWFIKKRYGILLNKPLRGAHISFINDSMSDLSNNGEKTDAEVNELWEKVKRRWDGKKVQIVLDLNAKTDSKHWWLNIPHDERDQLQSIRAELGLSKPHWGLHMSIGYVRSGIHEEHAKYIYTCIINGFSLN